MIGEILTGLSRVTASTLANRPTGATVESELNRQFGDREWSITNYRNEDVKLSVQSISVRPKYRPKGVHKGVEEVEGDHLFTHTGDENRTNTLLEKLSASFHNEWITKVQLHIENGNAESIRPSGIRLGYVMTRKTMHFDGYSRERQHFPPIPPIRVRPTHEFQNDKLEMKDRYDGKIGTYPQRLDEAIDFLDEIQDQMESLALIFLLDLHKKGERETWPDPERAATVGEYLYDEPVSLDALDEEFQTLKTEIESYDEIQEYLNTDN